MAFRGVSMRKLKEYATKRQFKKTPEPKTASPKRGKQKTLLFTVQKHDASHLHYDFRIEVDGVLKSWAVPKGPSLNPNEKRLAIMVEDHPYDYASFEGIIPEGNYGAGTVMVWDQGTYTTPGASTAKECEQLVNQGLEKGHIPLILDGIKLRGEFALVRLKQDEKQWILFKKKDDYSTSEAIIKQDRSVTTGRTLREIAENKKAHPSDDPPATELLQQAPKGKMPLKVHPMLAVLAEEPFDKKGWLFEVKWDGYRAIAQVEKETVHLYSRNQKSFNKQFENIVEELKELQIDAVLDGEVVVLDKSGRPQFQLLQNYEKKYASITYYYVFDLLYLNGFDLRTLPLLTRKEILKSIVPESRHSKIRFSDHIEEHGIAFFKEAEKNHLEGIIGKREDSPYIHKRSSDWMKIKTRMSEDVVIGGFTKPRGSRKKFGALLVGVYEKRKLVYVGHVGGGFTGKMLEQVYSQLEPLITSKSPFTNTPKPNTTVTWVKPKLKCEVEFAEWTDDQIMRQPVFKRMLTP